MTLLISLPRLPIEAGNDEKDARNKIEEVGIVPIQESDQYKELCNDHRFFGDVRFKQLTLWSVGMGVLINAMMSQTAALQPYRFWVFPFIGMLFTAVFWILEVRSSLKGVIVLRKICELEKHNPRAERLGIANWTFVNQTNAVALLYALSYIFWWWLAFPHRGEMHLVFHTLLYIFPLLWLTLLLFTIREYLPLWEHARERFHL